MNESSELTENSKQKKKKAFYISAVFVVVLNLLSIGYRWMSGTYSFPQVDQFSSLAEYYGYITGYTLGHILMILFLLGIVYLIATILGKVFKVKENWGLTFIASFMILLIILFSISAYYFIYFLNKQQDIHSFSEVQMNENGDLDLSSINGEDMKTEEGKKIKEFYEFVADDIEQANLKFDEYSANINDDRIYESKEYLQEMYGELDNFIDFIKNYRSTLIQNRKAKYKEIFGKELTGIDDLKPGNTLYDLYQAQIDLFESQKILYKFYIDNFDKFYLNDKGLLVIDEDIISEYDEIYTDYDAKYDYQFDLVEKNRQITNEKLHNIGN